MKELEGEHYIGSIIYLIEQLNIYCRTKSEQFIDSLGIGLNLDQYSILDTIDVSPGICQMELAKLILKDRSYTSRLVIFLEKNGFIERRLNTKSNRLIRELYITQKGKQILTQNQSKLKSAYADALKNFSDAEYSRFRNDLEKMKECVSKYTIMPL